MHVDDFLWAGTKWFENTIVGTIRNHFKIKKQHCNVFKYIGMNIEQGEDGVVVHQDDYCKTLQAIELHSSRLKNKDFVCTDEEREKFRSLVGQLGWLCTNSCPDLSFEVLELSTKIKNTKIGDIVEANKCLRKACLLVSKTHFPKLDHLNFCKLVVYSDASHANLSNGVSSAGGFIVFSC